MTPDKVVQVTGLRRTFGEVVAVSDLSFEVLRGQFLGFLGPNGAGKSTTIKILTGLLQPTSGSALVLGMDLQQSSVEIKRRIGVVPEGLALFEKLSGNQLLNFVGRIYGLDRDTAARRSAELLEFMELSAAADQLVGDYSHGMKKKIALAAAIIHRPEILFLDEPFEGVDAVASKTLKELLLRFTEHGGTVFLTSHVLEVVERLCSHIIIIDRGRLVVSGSIEELHAGVAVPGGTGTQMTLEQIFLHVVKGEATGAAELSWI